MARTSSRFEGGPVQPDRPPVDARTRRGNRPARRPACRHPSRAYLVVEVAETSLATDRAKALLYALAGVYWIIDVRGAAIEVRRRPAESGYQDVTRHGRGEVLAVPEFAEVSVRVEDVLPPA